MTQTPRTDGKPLDPTVKLKRLGVPSTRWGVVAVTALGCALSIALFLVILKREMQQSQNEFVRQANQVAEALEQQLENSIEAVRAVGALYAASEDVTRAEFQRFAQFLLPRERGITALEWVPRVTDQQRGEFETRVRDSGSPSYEIREFDQRGTLVRASPRPEYFPVSYVEPSRDNAAALNFDVASDARRRAALDQACETGQVVATEGLELVQKPGGTPGVLLCLALYRAGAPLTTPAQRHAALTGFVLGVLQLKGMVGGALGGRGFSEINLMILDPEAREDHRRLYTTLSPDAFQIERTRWTGTLEMGGRHWLLLMCPVTSARGAGHWPWAAVVLAVGLTLTGLTAAYLGACARHTSQIQRAHEQIQTTLLSVELAQRETTLLDGITQKISSGLELNQILDFVFESFDSLIPYERIGYASIDDKSQLVQLRWLRSRATPIRMPVGYSAQLRKSSLDGLTCSGVPRILNDLVGYLETHPQSESTRLIVEEGMRSSLTCPLVVNGLAVGLLFFSSARVDAYGPAHVDKFMRVARQLSFIVQKGRCYDDVSKARTQLARLLDDMLPPAVQQRLAKSEGLLADSIDQVTVVFADLVAFSTWSSQIRPDRVVALLNRVFRHFDHLVARYGLLKVGSQGDSYLAVAGAPSARANHLEAAARAALAMQRSLVHLSRSEQVHLTARIGIHTGPVIAGVIGRHVLRYDIWGQTVNLASRLESSGQGGRVQVSEQVYQCLKGRFRFEERGWIDLKGFGAQRTWWLLGRTQSRSALLPEPLPALSLTELGPVGAVPAPERVCV